MVLIQIGCNEKPSKNKLIDKVPEKKQLKKLDNKEEEIFLDNINAIPFLFEYAQKNKENKVRIITKYGNIDILLYEKTPYHLSLIHI